MIKCFIFFSMVQVGCWRAAGYWDNADWPHGRAGLHAQAGQILNRRRLGSDVIATWGAAKWRERNAKWRPCVTRQNCCHYGMKLGSLQFAEVRLGRNVPGSCLTATAEQARRMGYRYYSVSGFRATWPENGAHVDTKWRGLSLVLNVAANLNKEKMWRPVPGIRLYRFSLLELDKSKSP